MAAAAWIVALAAAEVVSAAETDMRESWWSQPILEPGTTRGEVERFVQHRVRPLVTPESADAWHQESGHVRQRVFDEVMYRGVPKAWYEGEPAVEWTDTLPNNGYRIRKLRYEALPGLWIPALLYEPDQVAAKTPAVLNVNGHEYGAGKAATYEQLRCINLAKRGILALHPEWLNCGELNREAYHHHRLSYLNLCGRSGVAVFYLAMKRGLDVLASHPNTDPERIAMTGLSGGGWQTIMLSALDTRIALSVPNAGYVGMAVRTQFPEDIGDCEQAPVDLATIADYTHLTAMLAPRPALLLFNEKDDCCFQAWRSVPSVFDPIVPFYGLFSQTESFATYANQDPGTHNYDRDNREQFYRFLNRHFLPDGPWIDEDIPSDDETYTIQKLRVGVPDNNESFITLAENLLDELPRRAAPSEEPTAARERLRNILHFKSVAADAELLREESDDGLDIASYRLHIGDDWTLPATSMAKAGAQTRTVLLLIADKGKAATHELAAASATEDTRVLFIDPILMGECLPNGDRSWPFGLLIENVGERLLGLQAAQVLAAAHWAQGTFHAQTVSMRADGWNAGVAAMAAAAVEPERFTHVDVQGGLDSLKRLITDRIMYEDYPALFCFGLLEAFDIADLAALVERRP
ncbi:MAG TPA: acetylxylan esterase [Candidatus Hydrogenedentes bacterium]|nr:acetylxylan esterase [Candidatus Hydrogenedentota bacterium]HPG69839.1 acetylxylan esterase [Candidatus Hydrogenedentota bacterium]